MVKKFSDFANAGFKIKPKFMGKTTKMIGDSFENRVKRYLTNKGYKISERENWHHDVIAIKNNKKYVVECKCTQSGTVTEDELEEAIQTTLRGDIYMLARLDDDNKIKLLDFSNHKRYKKQKGERKKSFRKLPFDPNFKF